MIKFVKEKNQIINVWKSVFGDSKEYINFFIDNCKHKQCVGYFEDEKLVSMLFLIDCSIECFKGKYIYAAATLDEYRNKGYMASLINYCKDNIDCDFLCLVPAEKTLFDYYSKFGFKSKLYTSDKKEFSNTLPKLTLDEFKKVRRVITDGYSTVNWADIDYFYLENQQNGGYFSIYNNDLVAIRDGMIIETVKDHFCYRKVAGMIYSKSNIKDTYIGLYLD